MSGGVTKKTGGREREEEEGGACVCGLGLLPRTFVGVHAEETSIAWEELSQLANLHNHGVGKQARRHFHQGLHRAGAEERGAGNEIEPDGSVVHPTWAKRFDRPHNRTFSPSNPASS